MPENNNYRLTFRGFWQRCVQEYRYFTRRPWSLEDVGRFWDSVTDYDGINNALYTHHRRFTDSYRLACPFLNRHDYLMLDLQTRSGKPALFWHDRGRLRRAVCADFSDRMLSVAGSRLAGTDLDYVMVKVRSLPLPFENGQFTLACSYETVEHVHEYDAFIGELARVMSSGGLMIITCPIVMWEAAHWITAILNINHSEGPHRFLKRRELINSFRRHGLQVLAEDATVLLPFNHPLSITIDQWLEGHLPSWLKRQFCLRRVFVLTHSAQSITP